VVVGRPKSLWDSYIVGFPSLWKTYATSGTCAGTRRVPAVICPEALTRLDAGIATKRLIFWQQSYAVRSTDMLDIILVAGALGFFALSVGYTIACDRL
jgi:hypothetical protein